MTHTRLLVVALILAGIILVGFVVSVPHARDGSLPTAAVVPPSVPSVALSDSFKKGVHTITGSLSVPNSCVAIQAQATLVGTASSTQTILVAISIPEDSGVCLQQKSIGKFSTTVTAPARLPFVVTVNGTTATTTGI